jgi:hypothetical protein
MSSRQEEKERRRQERLEREQAEARAASRSRRLQLVVGGVIAAAAVAAVVVALTSGGGDGGADGDGDGPTSKGANVAIPEVKERDLQKAAKAAGCVVLDPKEEGSTHVNQKVDYKSNPPTSGNHNPTPADDGIYAPGNTPAKENYVHTLEHGRIEIQYKPGTPQRRIEQLETLFNEKVNGTEGYHTVLFENNTAMTYAVAATAWTHLLGCKTFDDEAFDALRAFREAYVDKGPEFVP